MDVNCCSWPCSFYQLTCSVVAGESYADYPAGEWNNSPQSCKAPIDPHDEDHL